MQTGDPDRSNTCSTGRLTDMTYDYEAVGPVMSMQPKDAHRLLIHSLEAAM